MKPLHAAAAVVLLGASGTKAFPEVVVIDHKGTGCVMAERFPKLVACFKPGSDLVRARVYFRARGHRDWHYVEMTSDAACHIGVLPKPQKDTISIDYYFEAIDRSAGVSLSAEYHPRVVTDAGACTPNRVRAATVPKAFVLVGAQSGTPSFPDGFVGGAQPAGHPRK